MAFAAMAFAAAPAAADKGEVDVIGGPGDRPGEFTTNIAGVAVNEDTGRVYVVDPSGRFNDTSRIHIFESDGTFVSRFGAIGSGKGEFSEFSGSWGPQGIAISPGDGSLYVTDPRWFGEPSPVPAARVQKFDADGNFELMWGWGVRDGTAEFQVCTDAEPSCESGIPGDGAGQFGTSTASARVAVDPAPPHHVFVADTVNRRIQEFTPTGDFVRAMGWGVRDGSEEFQTCTAATGCQAALTTEGTEPGRFGANRLEHLAIDAGGVLYASDSTLNNRVQRIDLDAATDADMPMPAIGGDGPLLDATTAGLAVDGSTGNLLVLREPRGTDTHVVVQELEDPAGTPAVIADHGAVEEWAAGSTTSPRFRGVDVNSTTGDIYVSRPGVQQVAVLNIGALPDVTLLATTNVGGRSATLNAEIDPNNARTRYRFEYREVGASEFSSVGGMIPRGEDSPRAVSEEVEGLIPGADYEVQLTVSGFGPEFTVGDDATGDFSTPEIPPTISERPAALITDTTALLQAEIDPSNRETTYHFEWGLDDSYAISIPIPSASLPIGNDPVVVQEQLSGLQPETTYHFRVVADNGIGGEQRGLAQTFTTEAPPTPQGPLDRGYELVSPAGKYGGIGVGYWPSGIGGMGSAGVGAYEGERFAASSAFGSTLDGDNAFSYGNDWTFAERAGDQLGWQTHPAISHPNYAPNAGFGMVLGAAADDLSTMTWGAGNTTLAIFPELADAGDPNADRATWVQFITPLVSDWGGPGQPTRWELFGPTALEQKVDRSKMGVGPNLWDGEAVAGDGSAIAATTFMAQNGLPRVHGLAGPDDPTWPDPPSEATPGVPAHGDLVAGRSIYLADVSGELADSFAGTGPRELVNVCTGEGTERTVLPAVAGGLVVGEECPEGIDGRSRLVSDRGATLKDGGEFAAGGVAEGAISDDGSRVFFMSPDPRASGVPNGTSRFCENAGDVCPPQLYVRQQNPDGSVVVRWISRAEDGLFGTQAAALTGTVVLEGATPDGSKVFFRTNSPLTADDPNGADAPTPGGVTTGVADSSSWDLYRYELPDGPDPAGGELIRISAGPDRKGDCRSPLTSGNTRIGALRFASEDGARAYFTCQVPLEGVPAPANGTITRSGGDQTTTDKTNLYLYDEHLPAGERYRFIARLPRETGNSLDTCASTGVTKSSPFSVNEPATSPGIDIRGGGVNCVRGTSDGAFVTFFTTGRLTGDDPAGERTGDIYGYDAEADELVRISAPQGGVGGSYDCSPLYSSASPEADVRCHGDGGADNQGSLDAGAPPAPALGVATDPLVAGDRIAFFQSAARLVPEDTDDAYDIYQWRNGELSLITTGDSESARSAGAFDPDGALYLGNDRSGRNVYFVTRDSLSWQDTDAVADIYTARVGGGIPEPPPAPACAVLADGCQPSPPPPPAAPSAGSKAFQGPGNVSEPASDRRAERCQRLARRALLTWRKAKRFQRAAKRASGPRARVYNRRAKRGALQARRTAQLARRCRAVQRANAEGGARR